MAIKDIVKDVAILKTKSTNKFYPEVHAFVEKNLIDTAKAHQDNCLGLAAIQIGEAVRVFVIKVGDKFLSFRNPMILWRSKEVYSAKEGCLSLEGTRNVTRNETIKVMYEGGDGKNYMRVLSGLVGEVFQHEYDHLNGVLI